MSKAKTSKCAKTITDYHFLTNVNDCVSGNILSGKSILGVNGSLSMPTISQDGTTKILSIS